MRYLASLLALSLASLTAQRVSETGPTDQANAMVVHSGEQIEGTIDPGDVDWYRITLQGASDLMVWTGPGATAPIGDTVLRVFSGSGDLIREVDNNNVERLGQYSSIELGNLPAGSYFIVVRGFGSRVGDYTLDVVAAAAGSMVPYAVLRGVIEAPEPNDPRIAGGGVSQSAPSTRNQGFANGGGSGGASWVSPGADNDFWFFRITGSPATVTLVTGPGSGVAVTDTVLFVTDTAQPAPNVLAADDDSGPGAYSRLTLDLAPGTYYAVVRGRGPADIGNYVLDLLVPSPNQPAVASVVRQPHSCLGGRPTGVELGPRVVEGWPLAMPEVPVLGSFFSLDLTNMPPGTNAVGLLGEYVDGGVSLSQWGLAPPWCRAEIGGDFNATLLPPEQNGRSIWDLQIPRGPQLLGIAVQAQAAVFDPNTRNLWMSGRCTLTVGVTR